MQYSTTTMAVHPATLRNPAQFMPKHTPSSWSMHGTIPSMQCATTAMVAIIILQKLLLPHTCKQPQLQCSAIATAGNGASAFRAMQFKVMQFKAMQSKVMQMQFKAKQCKAIQFYARQCNTMQGKARQCNAIPRECDSTQFQVQHMLKPR